MTDGKICRMRWGHRETKMQAYVSPLVLLRNSELVAWVRTLMTIVAGVITGILGLTGAWGVLSYLASHAVVSLALLALLRFRPDSYFPGGHWATFIINGVGENRILFILLWALGFAGLWVF